MDLSLESQAHPQQDSSREGRLSSPSLGPREGPLPRLPRRAGLWTWVRQSQAESSKSGSFFLRGT